jgi:hypothetical protein
LSSGTPLELLDERQSLEEKRSFHVSELYTRTYPHYGAHGLAAVKKGLILKYKKLKKIVSE